MREQIDDISNFDYDLEIYKNGDYTDLVIIDDTKDETVYIDISIDKETLKRFIHALVNSL